MERALGILRALSTGPARVTDIATRTSLPKSTVSRLLSTLEGDPRFFFDDSQSPQGYGSGTEEWAGGGDYWGGLNMTLPFGRLALASLLAAKGDTAGANVQIEILKKQWARADAEFLPAKELTKLSR